MSRHSKKIILDYNSLTILHCIQFIHFYQKPQTCDEGGVHLGISFWHLLMNLKNNYLLKKLLKWANIKNINF